MTIAPRRLSRLSLLSSAVAAAALVCWPAGLLRADTTATWATNANSFWSNAADWSTNPTVPNNGGGTLYDVVIGSGTVALDISPEIQLLNLSNATLNGPGTLTIDGTMTWGSNGLIGAPILAKGGIGINGVNAYIAGGTVTNSATTTLNQSSLHFLVNGPTPSVFVNTGTFNATGSAGNIVNDSGTNNSFINNGLMTSSISGTFNIASGFAFINNGTLSVTTGTTTLGGNETGSSGTYLVSAGAALNFNGGNHTFVSGSNFAGQGNVQFTSTGTTTLAGANYNVSGITTLNNGYLNSVGSAVIGGVLDLNNSDIIGTVVANGGITITVTNAYVGGTLTNSAGQATTLSQSTLHLLSNGGNAGTFINNGSFNATGSAGNIFNDSGTANVFINNGLITSSVTGSFNIAGGYAFINNGTLSVTAGTTLIGANETASSGTYLIAAGATLNFNSGNHTFLPGATISGAGNVMFTTGGTTTLSSGTNFNISGTTTLTNGYLNTSSPVTLNGVLDINNGEILGNVTAAGGLTMTTTNAYVGGTLTNAAGKTTTLSQSTLHLLAVAGQPGFFINNGSFNASGAAGNIFNDSGTANVFINNGVITSTISGSFNIAGGYGFLNNGTLSVTAGTTLIGANETASSGTYLIAAGATLNLSFGNHTFLPAAIISGAGNFLMTTGGTTTLAGSSYKISGTTTLTNGYLNTSSPVTLNGVLDINNGEILGNVTAAGGLTMTTTNAYVGGTLTNAAGKTTTLSQSTLHLLAVAGQPGFFINNGSFNASGTAGNIFNDSGTANVFINNGVITSTISGSFNIAGGYGFLNNGTLSVTAGTTLIGANETASSGTYLIAAGATLNLSFGNHTFLPAAIISGAGTVLLTTGGTTTLAGPNYMVTGTTNLTNGFLDTTAPTSISGILDINNGEILGTIAANGGLTITTANAYIGGGTLTNSAGQTATLSQSTLHFVTVAGRPAFFINNGSFNASGTAGNIFNDSGTANVFSNNGILTSTITGIFNLAGGNAFNNAGTFIANAGTVTIASNGTHTGAFVQNAGKILFTGGTNNFNAGSSILILNVSNGRVVFNAGAAITAGGSMTLTGGTTVLASGPDLPTKVSLFAITNNTAKLDLTTSKMIVQATAADKLTRLTSINTSLAAGAIISSNTAGDTAHYGVGLFDNGNLNFTTFGGTTSVDSNSILLAISRQGDTNHSGIVDIQDQSIVTNHWQTAQNNWTTGDINHDGFVDLQDLTLVTNNWQQSSPFSQLPIGDGGSSTVPIPEPSTLLFALLCLPLVRFRIRRSLPAPAIVQRH